MMKGMGVRTRQGHDVAGEMKSYFGIKLDGSPHCIWTSQMIPDSNQASWSYPIWILASRFRLNAKEPPSFQLITRAFLSHSTTLRVALCLLLPRWLRNPTVSVGTCVRG